MYLGATDPSLALVLFFFLKRRIVVGLCSEIAPIPPLI